MKFSKVLLLILYLFCFCLPIYFFILSFNEFIEPITFFEFTDLFDGGNIGFKFAHLGLLFLLFGQLFSVFKRFGVRVLSYKFLRRFHILCCSVGLLLLLLHVGFPISFPWFPFRYFSWSFVGLLVFRDVGAWASAFSGISGLSLWFIIPKFKSASLFRFFRYFHILMAGSLYTCSIFHMILVVIYKFVSG